MMKQILKRLELIKTSIELDDEEIIELQINKIKNLKCDYIVEEILLQLEALDYSNAILNIKEYLANYSRIVLYEDEELNGLRLELKSLEEQLQRLHENKIKYLNEIDEFNRQYYIKLGPVIEEILQLKQENLKQDILKKEQEYKENQEIYKKIEETIDELKQKSEELIDVFLEDSDESSYEEIKQIYEELQESIDALKDELDSIEEKLKTQEDILDDEEFIQAKTDYEEFHSEYEQIEEENKQIFEINEEEKKELKTLYRKASRLCHPDIVVDALKEQANEIMQMLNTAYAKKDLQDVKKILQSLEKGMTFEIVSDTIEDKTLLSVKIEELREKQAVIIQKIDEIKEDDTFKLISELENWDEYFDQVFEELHQEKSKLINDQQVEVIETWIDKLWQWADENNIPSAQLSRKKENLISTKTIDFTGLGLDSIPDEICNLKNLTTLVLWDNNLAYLPEKIINFKNLKKLNLRGNSNLSVTIAQKKWIDELKLYSSVFIDNLRVITEEEYRGSIEFKDSNNISIDKNNLIKLIVKWIIKEFKNSYKKDLTQFPKSYLRIEDEAKRVATKLLSEGFTDINLAFLLGANHFVKESVTLDMFINTSLSTKASESLFGFNQSKKSSNDKIVIENSSYSQKLQDIEVPNFEKIRRVCNNLVKSGEADNMQEYLAHNGKMHKAFIYDALEQFINNLDAQTIDIVDWGCGQGINSMLVLDFIREKQLTIEIKKVILLDKDVKELKRAITQVDALNQNSSEIIGLEINQLNAFKNLTSKNNLLHIFANDQLEIDFDNSILASENYAICLSQDNESFGKKIYNKINSYASGSDIISDRYAKVGRFKKYEMIFKVNNK